MSLEVSELFAKREDLGIPTGEWAAQFDPTPASRTWLRPLDGEPPVEPTP